MISQRSRYALKALIKLARLPPGTALSTRLLASQESIPSAFLEQIMIDLKRAGFVASKRGRDGGYVIDQDPAALTLATIMRQIDGPVAPLQCLSKTAYRRCDDCADEAGCALRAILSETYEATLSALEGRTLKEAVAALERQSTAKPTVGNEP